MFHNNINRETILNFLRVVFKDRSHNQFIFENFNKYSVASSNFRENLYVNILKKRKSFVSYCIETNKIKVDNVYQQLTNDEYKMLIPILEAIKEDDENFENVVIREDLDE